MQTPRSAWVSPSSHPYLHDQLESAQELLERVCNRNEVRYLVELTGSGPTILSCEVFNDYVTGKDVSFTKALFSRDALNDIKLCGFGYHYGDRVDGILQ
jgi:hypothetical protein